MLDDVMSYIAPHYCCGCGKIGTLLCLDCKYNIIHEGSGGCIVCVRPTLLGVCSACKTTYDKAWYLGSRQGVLEKLVDMYKFERVIRSASELASLFDMALPVFPSNTVIVPVPTIASHIRLRGYDHALILAQQFAKRRKLPVRPIVTRKTNTVQHELNRKQRLKAAAQAFMCSKANADAPYLVIDDITTTGATLQYVAEALRTAGASTVWVAVVARQELK